MIMDYVKKVNTAVIARSRRRPRLLGAGCGFSPLGQSTVNGLDRFPRIVGVAMTYQRLLRH